MLQKLGLAATVTFALSLFLGAKSQTVSHQLLATFDIGNSLQIARTVPHSFLPQ